MAKIILEEKGCFWWHTDEIQPGKRLPNNYSDGLTIIDEEGNINLELEDNSLDRINRGQSTHTFRAGELTNKYLINKYIQGYLKSKNWYILLTDIYAHGDRGFRATNCLTQKLAFSFPGKVPLYKKIKLNITGLEQWMGLEAIFIKQDDSNFEAKYSKPDKQIFDIRQGQLYIEYGYNASWEGVLGGGCNKLSLSESVSLVFQPNEKMSVQTIKQVSRSFEDLFLLLTDTVCSFDWPTVCTDNIEAFHECYYRISKREDFNFDFFRSPLMFQEIKINFGEIFSLWISKTKMLYHFWFMLSC
jgi:hypothetical protein